MVHLEISALVFHVSQTLFLFYRLLVFLSDGSKNTTKKALQEPSRKVSCNRQNGFFLVFGNQVFWAFLGEESKKKKMKN
jgi:hypothetical protein